MKTFLYIDQNCEIKLYCESHVFLKFLVTVKIKKEYVKLNANNIIHLTQRI